MADDEELTLTTSGLLSSSADTEGMATAFRSRSMKVSDMESTCLKNESSCGAMIFSEL